MVEVWPVSSFRPESVKRWYADHSVVGDRGTPAAVPEHTRTRLGCEASDAIRPPRVASEACHMLLAGHEMGATLPPCTSRGAVESAAGPLDPRRADKPVKCAAYGVDAPAVGITAERCGHVAGSDLRVGNVREILDD